MTESQPVIIDFKAKPEQIKSVSLNNRSVPYQLENEHIVIDKQYVKPDKNEVFITFIVDDQSLNRRDDLIYTLLVPDRARSLFPCFDQPDMKASFGLVLEYPASWEAVTNSPMHMSYKMTEKDKKLVLFNYTEPISTYLFSFVVGKLKREVYNHNDREISLYHRETDPRKVAQCPEIASEVFDALDWMETYTAVPYPFTKYDLIILPGFQYGGMEHTGATLYTDRRMFLNEHPTLNEQLSRSALIAHSLLFSAALAYINGCQRLYPVDTLQIEKALWQLVNTATTPQHRLQTFRTYRNIASSPKAIEQLYGLWKKKQAPAGCVLSENDYISLSWLLALRLPERADEIVTLQQSRITNPDRKREYAFIAPSVSPRKAERDSVFASLLLAENRSVEPWVSAALANLNHSSRQSEAIAYIRPTLDALQDVQRTGDIFFPSAWLRALLTGHMSVAARDEVDRFFADNPDYPGMLSNKIRQQSDYLYRRK